MISLKEFKKLPRDEIRRRINEMDGKKNHYDPAVMEENGYEFTWASMKKVAEELGFSYGFFDVDEETGKVVLGGITVSLRDKDDYSKKTFFLDKEVEPSLEKLLRVGDAYGKAAILSAIVAEGCRVIEGAFSRGQVRFVVPCLEDGKAKE